MQVLAFGDVRGLGREASDRLPFLTKCEHIEHDHHRAGPSPRRRRSAARTRRTYRRRSRSAARAPPEMASNTPSSASSVMKPAAASRPLRSTSLRCVCDIPGAIQRPANQPRDHAAEEDRHVEIERRYTPIANAMTGARIFEPMRYSRVDHTGALRRCQDPSHRDAAWPPSTASVSSTRPSSRLRSTNPGAARDVADARQERRHQAAKSLPRQKGRCSSRSGSVARARPVPFCDAAYYALLV